MLTPTNSSSPCALSSKQVVDPEHAAKSRAAREKSKQVRELRAANAIRAKESIQKVREEDKKYQEYIKKTYASLAACPGKPGGRKKRGKV